MIRVLIVDDHAIVRQGLRRILDEAEGIKVAAEAINGVDALNKLRTGVFDIVLLDLSMPEKNGFDTLKQILDGNNKVKVLILSTYPEKQYAVRLMKAGASGYMSKDTEPEELVGAIRQIFAGQKFINNTLSELLLHECSTDSGKLPHQFLSNREYQVLRLLGSGKRVSDIARILLLNVKTVSTYRSHILEKINLKNNAELTCYVIENGLQEL
jgi:DNA-binding NarL/FixJ family response regulator